MKRERKLIIYLLALSLVFLLALGGCAPDDDVDVDPEEPEDPEEPAEPADPDDIFISIATASVAGAWYPLGGGIAAVLSEHVDGVTANAETAAASLENIRHLHEGEVELAFLQSELVYFAYEGLDEYEGNPITELRAFFATTHSVNHMIARADAPFDSLYDVEGMSIGVGAPGSGTEVFNKDALELHGITYDDIDEQFIDVPTMVESIKDRAIDLKMSLMPVPTGSFTELGVMHDIKILSLDEDIIETIVETRPGFARYVIPGGTYPGVDEDAVTVSWPGIVTGTTDMDEEIAYQITKTVWEKRDEWEGVHDATRDVTLENALSGVPIPLHAGAYRYYEEQGIDIPPELVPPEAQ